MTIVDKIIIRINPNIIDNYKEAKLTPEIVTYALSVGYKFNSDTAEKLLTFTRYRVFFKDKDEMKNYLIGKAENAKDISILEQMYDTYEIKEMLINNSALRDIFVSQFSEKSSMFQTDSLIDILGEESEDIDLLLTDENHLNSPKLKNIIIKNKSPKEIAEKGLLTDKIKNIYIDSHDPEKTLQLIDLLDETELYDFKQQIKQSLDDLPKMYKIIAPVLKIYEEKGNDSWFYTDTNERKKIADFFIKNVPYEKGKIPWIVLIDSRYGSNVLIDSPISVFELMQEEKYGDFYLSQAIENSITEEGKNAIAEKIKQNKIFFDVLPNEYSRNKEIFESTVRINSELTQNNENLKYASSFIKDMTKEEAIEYYKSLGIPFNSTTVDCTNFEMVLKCISSDPLTLSETEHIYTSEEYKKIADIAKKYSPKQILESKFLRENPYLAEYILENARDEDLEKFDLSRINRDSEEFEKIIPIMIKRGYSLSDIGKNKIKADEDGNLEITELTNFQDIIIALNYMKTNGLQGKLKVSMKFSEGVNKKENILSENLDYLKSYQEMLDDENNPLGISGIEFSYPSSEHKREDDLTFSIKQIIDKEELIKMMEDNIIDKSFSPLEKYIAIYDFVTTLRKYKFEDKEKANPSHSRSLYEILDSRNDAIVCVGYAFLMERLGQDLGINVKEVSSKLQERHAVNRVELTDSKYGINGVFTTDPTNEESHKKNTFRESSRFAYKKFLYAPEDEADKDREQHISPKVLIDAIINVKRARYKNFSEQDYQDLRMAYSIIEPFSINGISCYGEKAYDEYFNRTYEEIKNIPISEIDKKRPLLNIREYLDKKYNSLYDSVLEGNKNFSQEEKENFGIGSKNRGKMILGEYAKKIREHKKELQELGFKIYIEEDADELFADISYPIDKEITYEEYFENMQVSLHKFKVILGLEKEKKKMSELFRESADSRESFHGIGDTENMIDRGVLARQNSKLGER